MNAELLSGLKDSRLAELANEIATYQKELPRLLAEGHAGRHAVVHGNDIVNIWDTYADALQYAYERFGLDTRFAVKKIDPRDVERFAQFFGNSDPPCSS
jgi:hypothetical protein